MGPSDGAVTRVDKQTTVANTVAIGILLVRWWVCQRIFSRGIRGVSAKSAGHVFDNIRYSSL